MCLICGELKTKCNIQNVALLSRDFVVSYAVLDRGSNRHNTNREYTRPQKLFHYFMLFDKKGLRGV